MKPDKIILWLGDNEVSSLDDIPWGLRRFIKRGLDIRIRKNLKQYNKLVHCLKEFPEDVIITTDDDVLYPPFLVAALVESYRQNQRVIHCHRAHLIGIDKTKKKILPYRDWAYESPGETGPSHLIFPTGVGGVLYPPGCFAPQVLHSDQFMRICATNDDIWFKAMALLNGVAAKKVFPHSFPLVHLRTEDERELWLVNLRANDECVAGVSQEYGLINLLL